jgi:hypothetical protein
MALCTPVDLSRHWNAPRVPEPAPWDPLVAEGLPKLPEGNQRFWGIPFSLGTATGERSWLQLNEPGVEVPLQEAGVRYLVFAHFCDLEPEAGRPPVARSMVVRPGEVVAHYVLRYSDGSEHAVPIRRRFEINTAVAWGQLAFAARSHVRDVGADINGPYPRGAWGRYQTGVIQEPNPGWPVRYWVYALPNPHPEHRLDAVLLKPTGISTVAVAGITLYRGEHHPLRHRRLESFRIILPPELQSQSSTEIDVSVDLGIIARTYAIPAFDPDTWLSEETAGLGEPPPTETAPTQLIVDVTANPDATLSVAGQEVPLAPAYEKGTARSSEGGVQVELLTPAKTWLHVRIEDATTGRTVPARVHFRSPDGRYFPPYGHRHEVNANWFEDYGGDLKLGTTQYAYVDGTFQVELPVGDVYVEVTKGFEYRPLRQRIRIAPGQRRLTLHLVRALDWRSRGWVTADTHVHFISPQTAWLEGKAEGVNLINLLASQWGDLYTNVADITGAVSGVSSDDTIVYVGTENRQHLLGHMSLLGVRGEPVFPMTTSGPHESYIGDPVLSSMCEWADAARERDGVVVIPHFPNPYCEAVAEIVLGKVDAVEIKYFTPTLDEFGILEWYRFLNNGYRVGVVGGTDKMSATIPVGGVRTYALLEDSFTFASWAAAVRQGRTFTTSGPLIALHVEGKGPGEEIQLPRGGGTLTVEAVAESVLPFHELQIVCNGRVVANENADKGTKTCRLVHTLKLNGSGWVAARCVSKLQALQTWVINVAAHTSPVYIVAGGQELFNPSDATYMLTLLAGGLTWLDTLAIPADAERHASVRAAFAHAKSHLEGRLHRHQEQRSNH